MRTSSGTLNVAVCELTSVDDLQLNLQSILALLKSLESDPTDLVCFPENALFLRVREGTKIQGISLENSAFRMLAEWSRANSCVIHLGSVPVEDSGKLFNTSVVVLADGTIQSSYRKIHLFDVDVDGHKPVRESDVFAGGTQPEILTIKGWRIGSSICYDMRFSELYSKYAQAGVDVILIPSAFLVPTGEAHWEILVRARAIESQVYVLASAKGGLHRGVEGGTRATYGHSMIVDPWGLILAEVNSDQGRVIRCELRSDRIEQVRKQIPMKNHRRLI